MRDLSVDDDPVGSLAMRQRLRDGTSHLAGPRRLRAGQRYLDGPPLPVDAWVGVQAVI